MAVFSAFGIGKSAQNHLILDGVVEGFLPFALARLVEELGACPGPVLFIGHDGKKLDNLTRALGFINPGLTVLHFPPWDCLPYDRVSPGRLVSAQRLTALASLRMLRKNPYPAVIITSVNAVLQKTPPRKLLEEQVLSATIGGIFDMKRLVQYMENNGFEYVKTVHDVGEYAVRGSIVDLFPPGQKRPIRLDFFGDRLKTVRDFDPITQRTTEMHSSVHVHIPPMSEVMLTEETISYQAVSAGRRFPGMEHWLPLFYNSLDTLFDHTGPMSIVFDHLVVEALDQRFRLITDYYESRRIVQDNNKTLHDMTAYHPLTPERLYLSPEIFFKIQKQYQPRIDLVPFFLHDNDSRIKIIRAETYQARNFAPERNDPDINLFEAVIEHINILRAQGKKVLLAGWSTGSLDRLIQVLEENGMHNIEYIDSLQSIKTIPRSCICAGVVSIEHGFEAQDLSVIAEKDILGDRLMRQTKRRKRDTDRIREACSFNTDDIVVHIDHGIGRFIGLKTITAAGTLHDCLEIRYAGDTRLFLPVENIDLLSRYGTEGADTILDKLGGVFWQTRKKKLKRYLREIAGHLIKLAAERQMRSAPKLTPITGLYNEFVARFPYDETDDQLYAIDAVLNDLSSGHPMDRLVCGDVGFGKTEIAMRAAFVTVTNGLQVAVMVPSTLLARQHYKTFSARFKGFPVRIGHASRLVGSRALSDVKKGVRNGTLDIIIGTQALLCKAMQFSRLGLLIIDEEQHFGVSHKERLKELKADIHVLTLSAMPIPRTLQLALTGVRDLSLIATPPVDRLTVSTFIAPVDLLTIRATLLREYYRGGQSFYVCPRIADLEEVRHFLEQNTPELKVSIAHGQMAPGQLDGIMNTFYDGQSDVLLSTSIVESGLDIPTANTLVVHRADMFGLSTLYQLRGRVGRSKQRRAYALFTLPASEALTRSAERRLKFLQSLDLFGAGFQLANHDMDIRGAGNLVGKEQSGHIKEFGFEFYQQMLEEAMIHIKGDSDVGEHKWSPKILTGASVMIPESYIADVQLRLGIYRRVGQLENARAIDAFSAELIDRFGPLPYEVRHLLKIVHIKALCFEANIEKLDAGPKGLVIAFRQGGFANGSGLIKMIQEQGSMARIRNDCSVVFVRNWPNPEKQLNGIVIVLNQLITLLKTS